jgi:hypothetical protein
MPMRAVDSDFSPIERFEMVDHAQQRAFDGAARPHDHDHLATADRHIDALQDLPIAIGLLDVTADDDRLHAGLCNIMTEIDDQCRQLLVPARRPLELDPATVVPKIRLRMRPAPIVAAYSEARGSRRRLQCSKVRAAQQTGDRTLRTDILDPTVVFAGRRLIKIGAR